MAKNKGSLKSIEEKPSGAVTKPLIDLNSEEVYDHRELQALARRRIPGILSSQKKALRNATTQDDVDRINSITKDHYLETIFRLLFNDWIDQPIIAASLKGILFELKLHSWDIYHTGEVVFLNSYIVETYGNDLQNLWVRFFATIEHHRGGIEALAKEYDKVVGGEHFSSTFSKFLEIVRIIATNLDPKYRQEIEAFIQRRHTLES